MTVLTSATQSVIDWAGLQASAIEAERPESGGGDHDLFGWRVRSVLPLPGLRPWTGAGIAPHVVVRFGPASPVRGARAFSPAIMIGPDRSVFITAPGLGRFAIPNEAAVVIERFDDTPDSALQAFLLTEVLPVLCLLRGLVPLRASGVVIDGEGVLLAGMPGVGKSTLAAHMLTRGARLIGDGVCALRSGREGGPELCPGAGVVRLWTDTVTPLGLTPRLQSEPLAVGRNAIPVKAHALQSTPIRPGKLALIAVDNDAGAHTAVPMAPGLVMRPRTLVVGWRLAGALGCEGWVFKGLAAMLARMTCLQLRRGGAPFELDAMTQLLREAR